MSSYQFYEFQAVDRPLTEAEQRAVSQLSSRVDSHPRRAVFVYHYSDFRADEKQLLAKYYDAMFYIASWGTTRLMFRFPKKLINLKQLQPYCMGDHISCETIGDYVVLDMESNDEDGYGWTEGEGYLSGLISLRDDILQQDYRVLYLAWLSALYSWGVTDDMAEPPVPPGLQKLTPPLRSFMEAFQIDQSLVTIAAKSSPTRQEISQTQLREKIAALPRDAGNEWLLRLAQGKEAHLALAFQRFLLAEHEPRAGAMGSKAMGQRTAEELRDLAEAEAQRAKKRKAAAVEAQRIKVLEAFAPKAEESWRIAEQLIEQAKSKPYDDALKLLVKLHNLAIHQGAEAAYTRRLHRLRAAYPRKRSMLRRMDDAGLP